MTLRYNYTRLEVSDITLSLLKKIHHHAIINLHSLISHKEKLMLQIHVIIILFHVILEINTVSAIIPR